MWEPFEKQPFILHKNLHSLHTITSFDFNFQDLLFSCCRGIILSFNVYLCISTVIAFAWILYPPNISLYQNELNISGKISLLLFCKLSQRGCYFLPPLQSCHKHRIKVAPNIEFTLFLDWKYVLYFIPNG